MTTTVVTQQVTRATERDWNSGIFGCMDDMRSCLCGWCCTPCYMCMLAPRLGESRFLCCLGHHHAAYGMRIKLRMMLGISGSVCSDCLMTACCFHCTVCQVGRELDSVGM